MNSKMDMPTATSRLEAATRQHEEAIPAPGSVAEFWVALKNWASVIGLLLVQYFDRRSRAGRLSFLFMIAEPFIFIIVIYFIRGVFRGTVAQYGQSLLLFLVSGMLPFYMCLRTSMVVRKGQIRTGRRLPRITSMDVFIAEIAGSTLVWLLAMVLIFAGMYFYGIKQAWPRSIDQCSIALFLLVVFGAGFGLINAAITRFLPIWPMLIGYCMRGLVFFSGVFHISDLYRPSLSKWLAWNPILHGVDWFRLGVYGTYPVRLMDQQYLVKCAIIFLFVGIVADRASLRRGGV